MPYDPDTQLGGPADRFPSTRPGLLDKGGGEGMPKDTLAEVVAIYWKPVYKYIRRKWNRGNDDAKDLTQGFFASLLERGLLERFDPGKASFRTYLRTCVDGHVLHAAEAAGRLKRGGDALTISLDFDEAGREFQLAAPGPTPEEFFHQEWQRQVLALAVADLRSECAASGKQTALGVFEEYDLAADDRPSYAALAEAHAIPVTTVTNHLAWARRRLRELALARLARVTASEAELQQEAKGLLG